MKIAHFSGFPIIREAFIFIKKAPACGVLIVMVRAKGGTPGLG